MYDKKTIHKITNSEYDRGNLKQNSGGLDGYYDISLYSYTYICDLIKERSSKTWVENYFLDKFSCEYLNNKSISRYDDNDDYDYYDCEDNIIKFDKN